MSGERFGERSGIKSGVMSGERSGVMDKEMKGSEDFKKGLKMPKLKLRKMVTN